MPRWTPEARRKQAEIQKTRQSWKHSTGPKTAVGKSRSKWNAYKHGLQSAPALKLRHLLRLQSRLVHRINGNLRLHRNNTENDDLSITCKLIFNHSALILVGQASPASITFQERNKI